MVQVFDLSPTESNASLTGKAFSTGLIRNNPQPEQLVQQKLLQNAMDKLPQNANYTDFLKIVGPQLLTTPGGAQLLGELAPIIQAQSRANALQADRANRKDLQNGQQQNVQGRDAQNPQGRPSQQQPAVNVNVGGIGQGGGENYIRNPIAPNSEESTYPKRSLPRQPEPLRNTEQLNQRRSELNDAIVDNGGIPDQQVIENIIQNEENIKNKNNEIITNENKEIEARQQNRKGRLDKRFNDAFPNATPEEKGIFERFTNEANNAEFENDQYEHGRRKYLEYETAKNSLLRGQDLGGPLTNLWRKARSSFKSKEDIIKDSTAPVKKLIDLGLENEARDILTNSIGLGAEDAELTMFQPTKKQWQEFNTFPMNKDLKKTNKPIYGEATAMKYPGEENALPAEKFIKFKDDVVKVLKNNPGINIIAFRGVVNHDKGYSWTDFSKAISEAIDEGDFKPDPIQEQQLNVIRNAPLPGMSQIFNEVWKGTR